MIDNILNDDWSVVDDGLEELDVSILRETSPFELKCQHKDYQPDQIHRIFVYGSMKRGYQNNHRILGRPSNKFLGIAETTTGNFIMGTRGSSKKLLVPMVRRGEFGNYNIIGELYHIDGPTLFNIDLAEGEPKIYKRENVVIFQSGTLISAYIYLFTNDFNPDMMDKHIITCQNDSGGQNGTQRFRIEEYER